MIICKALNSEKHHKNVMRRSLILFVCLLLLSTIVSAKCGDGFCDPDETCQTCSNDCSCTIGLETHKVTSCCTDFACKDCAEGYCNNRECNSLKGFKTIFESVDCYSNGSINMEIDFTTPSIKFSDIKPDTQIKVFMKTDEKESTFNEISGEWRPKVIKEKAKFITDLNIFNEKGNYWIRVDFKAARGDSLYESHLVTCPGVIKEEESEEKMEEEPSVEEEKETIEITETVEPITDKQEETKVEEKGFFKKIIQFFLNLF